MEYIVELKNKKQILCKESETILEAATNAGITLEHSCMTGRCRSCMVQVNEGEVQVDENEFVLTEAEKAEGFILSCNTKPLTNLKLNIEDLGAVLPQKGTYPCKVDSIETLTPEIIKLVLRLPPNVNFKFFTGQYINIIKGSIKRSYSIANNLRSDSKIELLIKKYNGGKMSQYWFNEAKENDLLRFEGPLGTFFYRDSEVDKIILLATGTGIAPIKAILERFMENPKLVEHKKIFLVWGGRKEEDLFWKPFLDNKNFEFTPILSQANDTWRGEKGYVQHAITKKIKDFSNAGVYACGSTKMIEEARQTLLEKGLSPNHFYSDAFIISN